MGAEYYKNIGDHAKNTLDDKLIQDISEQLSANFYAGDKDLYPRHIQGNNILRTQDCEKIELAYISRCSRPGRIGPKIKVLLDKEPINLETRVRCIEYEKHSNFINQYLPISLNLRSIPYNKHLQKISFLDDEESEIILTNL
ncbi:hypothetical protein [Marivirga lumbricoides]|uniref:hypothetical protein n=1 Tax=Marivirga lumbricoides TaxID=1046115 RepID=UPI001662F6AE